MPVSVTTKERPRTPAKSSTLPEFQTIPRDLSQHDSAATARCRPALNQAVKRNLDRFPDDFMFQLSVEEAAALRSRTVTIKPGRGAHRKYRPYAFTEQGVAMLSSVLRSKRGVLVNVEIIARVRAPAAESKSASACTDGWNERRPCSGRAFSARLLRLCPLFEWARVELNYRPHAYQACALTT